MTVMPTSYGQPFPRRQAQLLVELLARPESALRAVLLGRWREGKSDLLGQLQAALFEKADGPTPFYYAFDPRRDALSTARHFAAAFCQQMRAFGMRQEEMLREPLALLEKEIERPGLPLALSELAHEFVCLSPEDQVEFAAALPAEFAHREGRPLCLLFDDAEHMAGVPALLSYIADPRLSWLITGNRSSLSCFGAERGWAQVPLQAFTVPEALSLAEDRCRAFETAFAPQAWEDWFELAETSPCWVNQLVDAAVVSGRALDSVESVVRVYVRELASGSIGRWVEGRWHRAFAKQGSSARSGDAKERVQIAAQLLESSASGAVPEIASPILVGLVAQQWLEGGPLGAKVMLQPVERDWLELALSGAKSGAERAEAGFLQAVMLRAERIRQWRLADAQLGELREHLRGMADTGFEAAPAAPRGGKDARLPQICSVAVEPASTAELYWCYGFRPGWPAERKDRPEAACLYLIAACRQEPAAAEVKQWSKRLQEEARTLPALGPALGAAEKPAGSTLAPRYELWLALPRGASLAPVAGERRLRWENLLRLLEQKSPAAAGTLPPMLQLERSESQARLSELEARAQWLEEELATAREQFHKEAGSAPHVPEETGAGPDADEPSSRLALAANLLLASADLLALHSSGDPAAMDSIREIQQRARRLQESSREAGPETRLPPAGETSGST
jgi:hypothetical protein